MSKKKSDEHAASFLGFAQQYQRAANELLDLHSADHLLRDPIYFLYAHAVEMLLKAFLRAHNIAIVGTPWAKEKGHHLYELYEECCRLGLNVDKNDPVGIRNVVILLDSGNRYQGFRYFSLESGSVPDLQWTRDIVQRLVNSVQPRVDAAAKRDQLDPTRPVKFRIAMKVM